VILCALQAMLSVLRLMLPLLLVSHDAEKVIHKLNTKGAHDVYSMVVAVTSCASKPAQHLKLHT